MVPLAVLGLPIGAGELLIIGVIIAVLFGPLIVGAAALVVIAGRKRGEPSQPPTPAAVAGWYPDPTSRHAQRYWSGAAWTEHVADDGVQLVDPLG